MPRFTAISLAAVLGGLAVLISLFVIYVWIWTRGAFSAQLSNGNGFLSVAMVTLNYLIGGAIAGVLARGNEVLNASLAGLAFGLLLWAVYLLFFGGDLSSAGSLSLRSVGIGALAFVVAICAAGGSLVALVRHQRKATE
jgi:hypothetical protein